MLKAIPLALAFLLTTSQVFEPARADSLSMEGTPFNTAAAGVVLTELTVDARGLVNDVRVLQDLAPYTDVVQSSARGWVFTAAREGGMRVESHVLVGGLFRPAMLMFPAPDAVRTPEVQPSPDTPLPTRVAVPPYPPNAIGSAYVVTELEIGDTGSVLSARTLTPTSGFDDAAVSAARQWTFRPGQREGGPVPTYAYLVFGFRQPN
jgi:TonB family protein